MTELNAKKITQLLSVSTRDKPNDDHEKMQFYYHPDHLGSSSYNLYSSPELKRNRIKGVKTMEVPVYKLTVSNESGSTNTYYYTRIGYRKDVNKQSTPAKEVTFDVRKDGDTFAAVIKYRWGKKNNVLELRDSNKLSSQTIKARTAKEKADRTAIQFHVKGATDGCLLSVGANNFKTQKPGIKIRKDLPLSSSGAQVSFMNDIMRFQKEDKGNRKGTDIKVSFKQIYTK